MVAVRNTGTVLVFIWQPVALGEPAAVAGGLGAAVILAATTLLLVLASTTSGAGEDEDKDAKPAREDTITTGP